MAFNSNVVEQTEQVIPVAIESHTEQSGISLWQFLHEFVFGSKISPGLLQTLAHILKVEFQEYPFMHPLHSIFGAAKIQLEHKGLAVLQ
jgi:hypothetical protein